MLDQVDDILLKWLGVKNISDNAKEAMKSAITGDIWGASYNVAKIIVSNAPIGKVLKTFDVAQDVFALLNKVSAIERKIGHVTAEAFDRLWTIAKKSPLKFNADYLKYVDDLVEPRFGAYFATSNTYANNFKNKFSDVADQIVEVHHAVPREIEYGFGLISNSEINSLENLRGMPSKEFHQIITEKWRIWLKPYKDTKTKPSIQFLLDKAKEIDGTYGANFIPPIR